MNSSLECMITTIVQEFSGKEFTKEDLVKIYKKTHPTTNNYVELTYTSGSFKIVCDAIVGAMNATHSSGFVVIADGENSVFVHPDITACTIAVVDAS